MQHQISWYQKREIYNFAAIIQVRRPTFFAQSQLHLCYCTFYTSKCFFFLRECERFYQDNAQWNHAQVTGTFYKFLMNDAARTRCQTRELWTTTEMTQPDTSIFYFQNIYQICAMTSWYTSLGLMRSFILKLINTLRY